ncbi:MAG: hypothetical protein QOF68_2148 [Gaiellales bacterium]|jgi:hypothetical protein|nr:hypothetical protein [Gaiellales bacterium]
MTYEERMHGGVRPWLSRKRRLAGLALLIAGLVPLAAMTEQGKAASSKGCEGGGFSVLGLSGEQRTTVLFTGAANPLDITGGRRTVVFASKTPNHRGLTLTGSVNVDLKGTDVVIDRAGAGLNMKLQAKDCANGGLFQMEPQRGDGGTTQITHTLATDVFYFDNPNFRAREGDVVPYKDTTVTVTPRINFANDVSAKFVGRDSPQVATRVNQGCLNQIRKRDGSFVTVDHCGGVSVWNVASGGRMGAVFGEDATEVAPPATNCVQDCQAQNRVRGQAVVLGHPFPVPASSRLNPRFPGA